MATALEKVRDPHIDIIEIGRAVHATHRHSRPDPEVAHYRIPLDTINTLPLVILNANKKGVNKRVQTRAHVLDAVFEDSIDKTPTFTLTIHDPDWDFVNSGALEHRIDLNPGNTPNRHYRLDAIDVTDDDVTLTFATRNAIYMSYYRKPKKANRKGTTRAQFILSLVRSVKHQRIEFICPQLKVRQPIGKTQFPTDRQRQKHRQGQGFSDSDHITVKGSPAVDVQRRTIEKVIQAGYDEKMPGLLIVAAVMTITQETNAGANTTGNPPYVGAFQQNHGDGWPGTGDAYKDAIGNGKFGQKQGGFYGWAYPIWRTKGNDWDLGQFIATVQGVVGSTNPLNYGYAQSVNKWRQEAQHAVNAFGGIDVADPGNVDTTNYYKKKFEFHVGPPDGPRRENYLAAMYRLAEDVHWSAFWVGDRLHYSSEEDLFKQKPWKKLQRYHDGVEHVQFSWDKGKRINQMTLQVRMERWVAPLGVTVEFAEAGPASGRWLVTNIRRSMFDELGEIVLSKPMREKKEPANEPGSRQVRAGTGGGSSFTDPHGMGLLTIEDCKSSWTPEHLINRVIPAYAEFFHMNTGLSPAMIKAANIAHGTNVSGGGGKSWHKGPGWYAWAVDLSNGDNTDQHKDDLASALIQAFNMPDLANWNATAGMGEIPGNLVNASHKGFDFQLIYRTFLHVGGNHYTHVHFGCRKPNATPPGHIPPPGHHKGTGEGG